MVKATFSAAVVRRSMTKTEFEDFCLRYEQSKFKRTIREASADDLKIYKTFMRTKSVHETMKESRAKSPSLVLYAVARASAMQKI